MPINIRSNETENQTKNKTGENIGVCILAAGVARRLEPISNIIAKPAFPLGGKLPIVELWVRKFVDAGMNKIAMNLHRVPESIKEHFKEGKKFLADIVYVNESTPSGTLGGAIKMVEEFRKRGFSPERVFIPSGDIVSGIKKEQLEEMLDFHKKHGAVATMMLAPIPWERRRDFGTVTMDGYKDTKSIPPRTYARITDFIEKDPNSPSNLNNASNYIMETDFLLELKQYLTEARVGLDEPCYDFGKHVFMGMKGKVRHLEFLTKRKDDLYGYEPGTFWYDIGNKRDYLSVNEAILQGKIQIDLPYYKYPWGWMGANVETDLDQITINSPVVIGHDCTIFPGAVIGPNVVLGDGWVVHREAKIKDAVLWPHYNFMQTHNILTPKISRIREVREKVEIETSIIVGGVIDKDIKEKTVDVKPGGDLNIRCIDLVPEGPRP
ncbi:MAG: sugar phosphate nucleotidyltransferase [bacterium]